MNIPEALRIEVPRHPLADKFKSAGLRQIDIARHCDCSLSYIGHILAGYRPAPTWLENKLEELAWRIDQLQGEEPE